MVITLTACDEDISSQYDGQVTAIITKGEDEFSEAIDKEQLNIYYEKSNEIGVNLFKSIDDANKLISPIFITNNLLEINNLLNNKFDSNLNTFSEDICQYDDVKEYTKSYFMDIFTKQSIWVNYKYLKQISSTDLNSDTINNFDFYILNEEKDAKDEIVNSYVKENLEIDKNLITNTNDKSCFLINLNLFESKANINAEKISYETKVFNNQQTKPFIIMDNAILKYFSTPKSSILEIQLDNGYYLDIIDFCGNEYDYCDIKNLITIIDEKGKTKIEHIELPLQSMSYNLNNSEVFKNQKLDFLFKNIKINKSKNLKIEQINELSKIKLNILPSSEKEEYIDIIKDLKYDTPFIYIIRDKDSNAILYIGSID